MPLDIHNYLSNSSSWNLLRDYIIETFKLTPESDLDQDALDKIAINFIKEKAKDTLPEENELKSFDRKIRDYKNNNPNSSSFSKTNLYRLLFVLGIDDINEVFSFCRNVIHQQELSARSLDDFIVLCCLKLHISYKDYLDFNKSYNNKINKMETSSKRLVYYITREHKDSAIDDISDINDLKKYIDEHIDEFARIRNTPYLMLFSCVSWAAWGKKEWTAFFNIFSEDAPKNYKSYSEDDWLEFANDEFGISNELMQKLIFVTCNGLVYDEFIDEDNIEEYISQKYKDHNHRKFDTRYKILEKYRVDVLKRAKNSTLSMKDYYLHIFALTENGLSENQINILASKSSPYRYAFMTYDNYMDMYTRKSPTEIKQGVYLLSYIHHYDASQGDYMYDEDWGEYIPNEYICDLFNPKGNIDEQFKFLNEIMGIGGFPALNTNDMFDKLFMDVYKEVLEKNFNCDSSSTIKTIFLSKLCDYLKLIADELSKVKE